ncbi:MAB_1171c family putative transporter [Actinokineospora sp.]|uniref:MAB_1171c family putative transporter n=1 Tax=Actinokineospora sp. TaxID=1872133 RepID=UPI0040384136
MAELLHFVVIGVTLLALGYKSVDLVRAPRPGLWALWSALLLLAVALILGHARVGGPIDRAVAGLGWLIQHELVFGGLFALQVFYVCSTHAPNLVRRAVLGRAAVVGAGAVLLLAAWAVSQAVEGPDWGRVQWAAQPWAAVANLAFVSGVAVTLALNARLTAHWARVADRRWLRRGLRLVTVGGWLSLGWAASRAAVIVAAMAGVRLPWDPQVVELVWLLAGLSTGLAGITLPAWAPRAAAAWHWLAHYRSYRRLAPLWRALRAATPTIALGSPAPWWHLEYRLYRRVIEIWDGRAALRAHVDPAVIARAVHTGRSAGLDGAALAAAAEAAGLVDALHGKRIGRAPVAEAAGRARRGSRVLADEVAWLERVAAAIRWQPGPVGDTVGAPALGRGGSP